MNTLLVLQQMIVLLAMMATGYLTCHIGWIDDHVYSRLSKLVVNVFNPILTIYSVLGTSLKTTGPVFWQNMALVFIFYALLFLAGFLVVGILRPCPEERPIYRMMTLLPNIGFMGIPIVAALLGTQYIIYVAIYMLLYGILIYTYGIALCHKASLAEGNTQSPTSSLWDKLKPILTNPGIIASVIALIIFFGEIQVPIPVKSFLNYMGNPSIPLSMFLIGCSLSFVNFKELLTDIRIYGFVVFKMLIFPIVCTFLIPILPFDAHILKLFIIMCSMPAGSMVVLIAEECGVKSYCATKGVVLSTIVCAITFPIVSLFL